MQTDQLTQQQLEGITKAMEPTTPINLTLNQLRVLAKSLGKTRDAELRKLTRLRPGTHVHTEVMADFKAIDSVEVEVSSAISDMVGAL